MVDTKVNAAAVRQDPMAARIESIGWGVFLVWVGVALLADTGWPLFFVGVGVVLLCGQLARRYVGLTTDRFAVVLGVCLVLAGGLRALDIPLGRIVAPAWLLPAVFIAAGVAVVLSAWRRRAPRP